MHPGATFAANRQGKIMQSASKMVLAAVVAFSAGATDVEDHLRELRRLELAGVSQAWWGPDRLQTRTGAPSRSNDFGRQLVGIRYGGHGHLHLWRERLHLPGLRSAGGGWRDLVHFRSGTYGDASVGRHPHGYERCRAALPLTTRHLHT